MISLCEKECKFKGENIFQTLYCITLTYRLTIVATELSSLGIHLEEEKINMRAIDALSMYSYTVLIL
jgi:hypothetical protein